MKRLIITAAALLCTFNHAKSQGAHPGKVAMGSYECWANGQARMLLNFKIKSPTQYTGSDDKPGNYTYNAASGAIAFKGGALDGVMPEGFTSIYHEPKGHPTVSFRGKSGAEASFCELVK